MLLVSLVLVNVVIAVLLDAFGKASAEEEPSKVPVEQDEGEGEDIRQDKCPFGESAPGHRFFFCFRGLVWTTTNFMNTAI